MIFVFYDVDHIRYELLIYDEYHIEYDLCLLSTYHIFCGISVTQIRKPQKPEPNLSKYLISQLLYILTFIIFFVLKSYNAC